MTDKCALRIAGHVLELSDDSIESRKLVRKVFALAPDVHEASDLTLHVVRAGSLSRPQRAPDRTAHHFSLWTDGDDQLVSTGGADLARVGAGRAVVDPGPSGFRGLHALLAPVLTLLFAERGLCVVHAAAFLGHDGEGAILALGGSGQGKSTLVTAALSGGRLALSDDLVVLRQNLDKSVDVSGIPQPLALPGDLADNAVVGSGIAGDHRQRRMPATAPAIDPDWHAVRAVVLVEHSDEPAGHLRRAEPRTTMHRLLASTLDGPSPGSVLGVFRYATAVANLPAWHLGHAATTADRVAAATRWLDEIDERVSARRQS